MPQKQNVRTQTITRSPACSIENWHVLDAGILCCSCRQRPAQKSEVLKLRYATP